MWYLVFAFLVLVGFALALAWMCADVLGDRCNQLEERMDYVEQHQINPHSRWLGRTVLARHYEADDWTPCVVTCVSWHGSMQLKYADALEYKGFWLKPYEVGSKVREVDA